MHIINLTQHKATPAQALAGVVDMRADDRPALLEALTFEELPSSEEIEARAAYLAEAASMYELTDPDKTEPGCEIYPTLAMVGGALWLMAPLCRELRLRGIIPCYAFSTRVVEEVTNADGSVTKTAVFKHNGFVEAIA